MKVGISSLPSYCLTLLSFTKLLTIIPFRFLLPKSPLFNLVQITCNNNALRTLLPCQCLNILPYRTNKTTILHYKATIPPNSNILITLSSPITPKPILSYPPTHPSFETHNNIRNVHLQQLSTSSYLTAHFN